MWLVRSGRLLLSPTIPGVVEVQRQAALHSGIGRWPGAPDVSQRVPLASAGGDTILEVPLLRWSNADVAARHGDTILLRAYARCCCCCCSPLVSPPRSDTPLPLCCASCSIPHLRSSPLLSSFLSSAPASLPRRTRRRRAWRRLGASPPPPSGWPSAPAISAQSKSSSGVRRRCAARLPASPTRRPSIARPPWALARSSRTAPRATLRPAPTPPSRAAPLPRRAPRRAGPRASSARLTTKRAPSSSPRAPSSPAACTSIRRTCTR